VQIKKDQRQPRRVVVVTKSVQEFECVLAIAHAKDFVSRNFLLHDLRRVLWSRKDYGLIDNPEMDFPLMTGAHRADEAVVTRRQESA